MKYIVKSVATIAALLCLTNSAWAIEDLCKNAPEPCYVVYGKVENTIYDPEALKKGELVFSVKTQIGNTQLSFVLNKLIPMGTNLIMGVTVKADGSIQVVDTVPYPGENPFMTNIDLPLACKEFDKCFLTQGYIAESSVNKNQVMVDIGGKNIPFNGPVVGALGSTVLMQVGIKRAEITADFSPTQKYINALHQFNLETNANLKKWQEIGKVVERELKKLP